MVDVRLGYGCGLKVTLLTPAGSVCDLRKVVSISAVLRLPSGETMPADDISVDKVTNAVYVRLLGDRELTKVGTYGIVFNVKLSDGVMYSTPMLDIVKVSEAAEEGYQEITTTRYIVVTDLPENAERTGASPKISDHNTWLVYNDETKAYEDSGVVVTADDFYTRAETDEKVAELESRASYALFSPLVFYKNKVSSWYSSDGYSALQDSTDYDCLLIALGGVDIKVEGATPAQYLFYSDKPSVGANASFIKYNTSGKYVEGAKWAIINFRHSENSNYNNLVVNTNYAVENVRKELSWKVVYVELKSRVAEEINALPEGAYFLNSYSNNLGVRVGESGWIEHTFSKNEIYIIDGLPYFYDGEELKSLFFRGGVGDDWSNKKWVCVGDSLTEVNSRATKRYYDYIAEKTGISIVNMGVGGTGYKDESMGGDAFYQRIGAIPTDADVVTIFGSGNDLSYTLGNPTDDTIDTICGCINKTIDTLFSVYPKAIVGIVTPTPWGWYSPLQKDNKMEKYCEAIKEICTQRGLPCLDLYHTSGLRPWDASYLPLYYSRDDGNSVHPDENGHALLAPKFYSFLKELIKL